MTAPPHLTALVEKIKHAPLTKPPPPWRHVKTIPVGGLWAVGFEEGRERLLVVSSSGQGLFDCCSGERLTRNSEQDGYDPYLLRALVEGPEKGPAIRMSGLHGGGLPTITRDGWRAETVTLEWPTPTLLLTAPGSWLYGGNCGKPDDFSKLAEYSVSELRAFGFSWTGMSLIIATSSDAEIYSRASHNG
jgi:hypothetical protein